MPCGFAADERSGATPQGPGSMTRPMKLCRARKIYITSSKRCKIESLSHLCLLDAKINTFNEEAYIRFGLVITVLTYSDDSCAKFQNKEYTGIFHHAFEAIVFRRSCLLFCCFIFRYSAVYW